MMGNIMLTTGKFSQNENVIKGLYLKRSPDRVPEYHQLRSLPVFQFPEDAES